MNAPPVLRPLRAILQKRLQIVPSRQLRIPYYVRASQLRPQLRYNSSTPPDQTPKRESSSEEPSRDEATENPVPEPPRSAQEAQNVAAENLETVKPAEAIEATLSTVTARTAPEAPVAKEQEDVDIPKPDYAFVRDKVAPKVENEPLAESLDITDGHVVTESEPSAHKATGRVDTLSSVLEEELAKRTESNAAQAARLTETTGAAKDDSDVPGEASRLPRNVQAFYLQPLRRAAKYGIPSCDLQLRSYNIRPLESFCDFALRAAYYLGLPAYGPTPLPKIIERWTVPKSSFIFKKSQENFERITRRRMIQIRDGHPETVQIWLAFLQKHQQAAVGMKANIWEFSSLDVAKEMDKAYKSAKPMMDRKFNLLGQDKEFATVEKVDEILTSQRYRLAGGR